MKTLKKLAAFGVAASLLLSCDKGDGTESDLASYIPQETDIVVAVNVAGIKSKATKLNSLLSEDIPNADYAKKLINALNYGIVLVETSGEKPYVNALLSISQIDSLTQGKPGNFKTPTGLDVYAIPNAESPKAYAAANGQVGTIFVTKDLSLSQDEIGKEIDKQLTKPAQSLVETDDKLEAILSENKEVSFWVDGKTLNQDQIEKLMPSLSAQPQAEPVDFSGTTMTGSIGFEKGEINAISSFYGNEKINEVISLLSKKQPEESTLNQFKIENPYLVISGGAKVDGLVKYLKDNKIDEEVNETLFGFLTTDDLAAMLNGDILIAAGQLEGSSMTSNVEIVLGVKDETKVQAFFDNLVEQQMITQVENHFVIQAGFIQLLAVVRDNCLIITLNNEFGEKLIAGEGKVNSALAEKLKTNSYLWIDATQITSDVAIKSVLGEQGAALSKIQSLESVSTYAETSTSTMTVKFTDKEQNALDVIADIIESAK